jgi:ribosomal protein L11 methyltransferase
MYQISAPIESITTLECLEATFLKGQCANWELYQTPEKNWKLQGYFESEDDAHTSWALLKTAFPFLTDTPKLSELPKTDWQNAYKQYLHPWSYQNLHWVPAWQKESYSLPDEAVVFYFDAGMAFGTGDHPTTQMCAKRLVAFKQACADTFSNKHIVDAGCGSGILAISAYLLGARNVHGLDNDTEAVRVSKENLIENNLPKEAVCFEQTSLTSLPHKTADLLLANIQADVLIHHAGELVSATSPQGWLCLSGILTKELESVRAAYEPLVQKHFQNPSIHTESLGEWSDLCFIGEASLK